MKKWIWKGLLWAILLYGITIIGFPLMDGEKLSYFKMVMGVPIWFIAGLSIASFFNRKSKKTKFKR